MGFLIHFVRCIEEPDVGRTIVEYLFRLEEAGKFDLSVFNAVRSMNDIFLTAHGEVATYCSRKSLAAIGSTCHQAHHLDGQQDGRSVHGE